MNRLKLRWKTGYRQAFLRDGNNDAKPVRAKARVLNKEKGTRAALVMQGSVCKRIEVCGERHSYAVARVVSVCFLEACQREASEAPCLSRRSEKLKVDPSAFDAVGMQR